LILGNSEIPSVDFLQENGIRVMDSSFTIGKKNDGRETPDAVESRLKLILPQAPSQNIIEWALKSKICPEGVFVVFNAENTLINKTFFKNAGCKMGLSYNRESEVELTTKLDIFAEQFTVGNGFVIENKSE
jgi:hypothetical protein